MKILAYVEKTTGLEYASYLLDYFSSDEYYFIVLEKDREVILKELKGHKSIAFLGDEEEFKRNFSDIKFAHFDWLLNLWGGKVLKKAEIDLAKQSLNIHPSFLPYCRGRDPVVWALRKRCPAGATLHQISEGVDEGSIWCQAQVDYGPLCKGQELYDRVLCKSYELFIDNWGDIRSGKLEPFAQEIVEGETKRRKDLHVDRLIDFDENPIGIELIQRILAHDFGDSYTCQIKVGGHVFSVQLKHSQIS